MYFLLFSFHNIWYHFSSCVSHLLYYCFRFTGLVTGTVTYSCQVIHYLFLFYFWLIFISWFLKYSFCYSALTVYSFSHTISGHGVQFKVPCFQEVRSCGRICNKPLSGCSHLCQRKCHAGPCLDLTTSDEECDTVCIQPCQKPRPGCGHPCGLPCHEVRNQSCLEAFSNHGSESQLICTALVDVVCRCGNIKQKQQCHQVILISFHWRKSKQFLLSKLVGKRIS